MPDLDRHVYDYLRAGAARVHVPAGDLGAVMARGRARRHRRTGAVAGVAFVAAASVTAAVLDHAPGGGRAQIVTGGSLATPPATGTQLSWRTAPAGNGLSFVTSLSRQGTSVYAVSTSPGNVGAGQSPTQQLYRSTDGLSWAAANGPAGYTTDAVASSGGRVYSVGTGPATASTAPWSTDVSWTANGGAYWQNSALPLDVNAPRGVTIADEQVQVAAGTKGVLATVEVSANVNLDALVPGTTSKAWTATPQGIELLGAENRNACGAGQQIDPAFPAGVGVTAKGVALTPAQHDALFQAQNTVKATALRKQVLAKIGELYGATSGSLTGQIMSVPCYSGATSVRSLTPQQVFPVLSSYSWGQLHIGAQLASALQGRPDAFYSSDGSSYQEVTLPVTSNAGLSVTATSTGFAAIVTDASGAGSPVLLQSTDGKDWSVSPFRLPATDGGVDAFGQAGGHLVVLGSTPTAYAAYTLTRTGWTTTVLPETAVSASFGPFGVAAVGVSNGGSGAWQVSYSRDGVRWSSASLETLSHGPVAGATAVVGSSQVTVTVTRPAVGTSVPAHVGLVGTAS